MKLQLHVDPPGLPPSHNQAFLHSSATAMYQIMSDLKLEFKRQIVQLQQDIKANNLWHFDPLGTLASHNKEVLHCSAFIMYQIMSGLKSFPK